MRPNDVVKVPGVSRLNAAIAAYRRFRFSYDLVMRTSPPVIELIRDEENKQIVFLAASFLPIPEALTEEFGTTMTQLRAALDHIATGLAVVANGGAERTGSAVSKVKFPICETEQQFKSIQGEIRRYFRPEDWQLIRALQPCYWDGTHWGEVKWIGRHPLLNHLSTIESLAIKARHRQDEVVFHGTPFNGPPASIDGKRITGAMQIPIMAVQGQPIGYWTFEDDLPDRNPTMDEIRAFCRFVPVLKEMSFPSSTPLTDMYTIPSLDIGVEAWIHSVAQTIELFGPSLTGRPARAFSEFISRFEYSFSAQSTLSDELTSNANPAPT